MPFYTFSLDTFQITNTRAPHTDTDFGILTVRVGTFNPKTYTSFMNEHLNINNGTYKGMAIPAIEIFADSPVTVNYLLANFGTQSQSDVNNALIAISNALALETLPAQYRFASCMALVNQQFAQSLSKIVKPSSCDGLVAAEQDTFTYDQLFDYTILGGHFGCTHTAATPGCNAHGSNYITKWSISRAQ